jgi:hypothetical protein
MREVDSFSRRSLAVPKESAQTLMADHLTQRAPDIICAVSYRPRVPFLRQFHGFFSFVFAGEPSDFRQDLFLERRFVDAGLKWGRLRILSIRVRLK